MKHTFNIEIILSTKQLKVLSEISGVNDGHLIKPLQEMAVGEKREHVISSNPNWSAGLGADINDILSLGFQALNHIKQGHKTKVEESDLSYHPYRIEIPKIKSISLK